MKEYQIHLDDLHRIFIGEVSGEFYFEVIIRTVIIYFILMISMKLMGQRMASQLSRIEMAAMVSLAAAVGIPLQAPDRGMLPAVIIAIVVVAVERRIAYHIARNERFEELSQDDLDVLVEDSVLNLPKMRKTRITRERLFAGLRSEGLTHLGMVKRFYFEANGSFSLIKNTKIVPGLCILPDWDHDFIKELKVTEELFCANCGSKEDPKDVKGNCTKCGKSDWKNGVIGKEIF